VSIALVGDKKIRSLNKKYRRLDKTTDVLSFQGRGAAKRYLGEVVINIGEAAKTARYLGFLKKGKTAGESGISGDIKKIPGYIFYFILVHGLLHLVGYDDATEKDRERMLERGRKFLERYFL
jgi:probable rRNA maturation factor